MQVNIEEVGPLTRRLTVVLPEEFVSLELEKSYRTLKKEVQLKGFRRGKVPRHILEQKFKPRVEAEVGEKLVQDTYFDAVEQKNLDPVVHPEIKSHRFAKDGTFSYVAEVDVRPEFELGDYTGIEVERREITVSEEEVTEELEKLRKRLAPLRNVEDRTSREGDLVVVDFQGYEGGRPLPQVKGENYTVDIGTGRNGEEFEAQIAGRRPGEEASFTVNFPAELNNPLLAGKEIEFTITVHEVKERVLPELDDEFAKDVGADQEPGFNTLEELKGHIRSEKKKQMEESLEGEVVDRMMQKLVEAHEFEVPERLVAHEIEEYLKQTEETLKGSGLDLESAGINRAEAGEHYRPTAEKRVRGDFILKKISELEEIKLQDNDLEEGFARIAGQYDMSVDEVKGYFRNRDDLLPLINELLNEKVLKFLRSKVTLKEVPASEEAGTENEPAAGPVGETE